MIATCIPFFNISDSACIVKLEMLVIKGQSQVFMASSLATLRFFSG